MKENKLNSRLVRQLNSIEKQLMLFEKDRKPDRLHRIRVEIKKLKSVFSFADKVFEKTFYHGELKPLFRAAGNVRAAQINIKLVKSLTDTSTTLINQLSKKEQLLTNVFIKNIHLYHARVKELFDRVALPSKGPRKKEVKKYFTSQFRAAVKAMKKEEREQMHRFRVKIKKIMYVYNSLPDKMRDGVKINLVAINKLQKKTGAWHDTYSAVKFLSHQHVSKKIVLKLKKKEEKEFKNLIKETNSTAKMLNTSV